MVHPQNGPRLRPKVITIFRAALLSFRPRTIHNSECWVSNERAATVYELWIHPKPRSGGSRCESRISSVQEISEIPADVLELWGEPSILNSEDPKRYLKLAVQFANDVRPNDFIEWFLVKDVLDLTWEILRLRQMKAECVEITRDQLVEGWLKAANIKAANFDVNKTSPELKAFLNGGRITARAFLGALPYYERIEYLLAGAEGRRAAVLREIDRRRDSLAFRMRVASDRIIDGELASHRPAAAVSRPGIANSNSKPAVV